MEKDVLSKLEVARLVALRRLGILPEAEERKLSAWVERDKRNRAFYERLCKKSLDGTPQTLPIDECWKAFETKYKIKKTSRRIGYRIAASVAILLVVASGIFWHFSRPAEKGITVPHHVTAVQLVLENGNKVVLDNPQDFEATLNENAHLHRDKQEIDYTIPTRQTIEIEETYHTIIVPKYGEYTVRLSDNTTVKLNSESTLTYPVQFQGRERKIRLTGEAYLDVAHDTTRRFIVETAGTTITVLGTTFNVNASAPDGSVTTTLVNGKVEVGNGQSKTIIHPGEQAISNPADSIIQVEKVDTEVATAWVRDMFYFNEQPLEEIMRELSHWYEFKVIFGKENLKQRKFTIEASRYGDIDKILNLLEATHVVKCRKEGKTIFIQ